MNGKALNIFSQSNSSFKITLLTYVTLIIDLLFLSNRSYYLVFLQTITMLIPTLLSIFLTVTFFEQIKIGKKNTLTAMLSSIIFSMAISTGLTILLYISMSYNSVNIFAAILNILIAGLGSIIFNKHFFKNTLYHENKTFLVITISTLFIALLSFTMIDPAIMLPLSILITLAMMIGFMYYIEPVKIIFLKEKMIINLKKLFNVKNFTSYESKEMLLLAVFTTPYIVLLNNGSIIAGILMLTMVITGIIFATWINFQDGFKNIYKNTPKGKKSQKKLMFFLISSMVFILLLTIFSTQILNLFNISAEYNMQYVFLILSIIPLTAALIVNKMFQHQRFFTNMKLETLLTIMIILGMFILTTINRTLLGVNLLIIYTMFITAVVIKNKALPQNRT